MSRVHELGRLPLLELIAIRENLRDATRMHLNAPVIQPRGWQRDQVIANIRDLEDPR